MTEVVAALLWRGDRFLACQRPAHKARGLLWEFAGGKTEPGETREQALEVTHEYPELTVHLTLFNAHLSQGEPKALEHNALRWITVEEIDELAFCPADEAILERLKRK